MACSLARALAAEGEEAPPAAPTELFPRVNERDPYKVLGLPRDASSEEIREARAYLVDYYAGHVAGVERIDLAYDKIIGEKLKMRKKVKGVRLEKKSGRSDDPPLPGSSLAEKVRESCAVPDKQTLTQHSVLFAFITVWAIQTAGPSGPAFQVAVALITATWLLMRKRGGKQFLAPSLVATFCCLFGGWLVGAIVPVYVPVFPPSWSPETVSSLFSFVTLWAGCTFLK